MFRSRPEGLRKVGAALDAADSAKTRRQKRNALAAIAAAESEMSRHSREHALDRELVALVDGRNWSDDRVLNIERRLTEAKDRLTKELV